MFNELAKQIVAIAKPKIDEGKLDLNDSNRIKKP